jgi:NAD(P)-dependent dehydrogenase (short-subunit alcohol dehydrogenase family)
VPETVRQRGAEAVPLRLDVGESASFIAFRDDVIAALGSEWKASSFDYLVNNANGARGASILTALPPRNRWFADSLLEEDGFEPVVPPP